jgi:4-alpha-glucanotransferase
MDELRALRSLARVLGVRTRYTDGLGRRVEVSPETLLRVCSTAGAPVADPGDAADALRAHRAARNARLVPPVVVAWNGTPPDFAIGAAGSIHGELRLADGSSAPLEQYGASLRPTHSLPVGYHHFTVEVGARRDACTIIAAPLQTWRRPSARRSWGLAAQLGALRSARSRSLGDLRDLRSLCAWVKERGGDVISLLPLLPTFNTEPAEPSPYSPVSRLFWSELILDLGEAHQPAHVTTRLDVTQAAAEVRAAVAGHATPQQPPPDDELRRYASFRGAQARLGRNWRDWPAAARAGVLEPHQVDHDVERFHLVAQELLRRQLDDLKEGLDRDDVRLGLDLAVGVHPDGYDPWSRQSLFGERMSVGAPPDAGFPSGQDWGFAPVLPEASRRDGHRYLAACIAHQARLAGLLRVDHIMAWSRLYWIPHGFGLHEGTYVSYPAEELFAVLALESVRNQCEVVGENLGTVPPEIDAALPRHRIWGMYLAQFQASKVGEVVPPTASDVAMVGTHDTPTFAGWLAGDDIAERVQYGLLAKQAVPSVRDERARAAKRLARRLRCRLDDPPALFGQLLEWLGRSDSPAVIAWLEDLWLEERAVNLPGTSSADRPNWQRPMARLLDELMTDPLIDAYLARLQDARSAAAMAPVTPRT